MKKIMLLTIAAAAVIAGCGDDGAGPQTDTRAENFLSRFVDRHPLILGQGEAWIEVGATSDGTMGFIFREDGTFDFIMKNDDGTWSVDSHGTWSDADGINFEVAYRYRFIGDVLVLEYKEGEPGGYNLRFTKDRVQLKPNP